MKKVLCIVILAMALIISNTAFISASEVDILVRKLAEKGILSKDEGQKILNETKQEAAKEKEQAVKEAKAAVAKDVSEGKLAFLPEWVRKTKLYGDFRLRYNYTEVDDQRSQSQGRYRVRLNLDIEIAKKVKFIFGLASGGNDPRSANQSFGGDWILRRSRAIHDSSPPPMSSSGAHITGAAGQAFFAV